MTRKNSRPNVQRPTNVAAEAAQATPMPGNEHLLEEHESHPRGTLAMLLIYLVILMSFWGYVYSLLFLIG
jgi:hypothetical protein